MEIHVGCIVEGHGDREAVPVLIRRIAERLDPALVVHVAPPIRTSRYKLVNPGELERAVELVTRRVGGQGAVLILLDSEDDCPAHLGPELLRRAVQVRSDVPLAVVLAKCEFESWFLAAADSLRGNRGLVKDLSSPPDPEAIRGAKEWLSQRMESGRTYSETLDQPALAACFDFDMARRADSFDKCYRDIVRLLTNLPRG